MKSVDKEVRFRGGIPDLLCHASWLNSSYHSLNMSLRMHVHVVYR